MFAVMQDGLFGGGELGVRAERMPGVWISIESREVAAGNLDPDSMPGMEEVGCYPKVNFEPFRFAWFEKCLLVAALAITSA
jgi:hypothetical protein